MDKQLQNYLDIIIHYNKLAVNLHVALENIVDIKPVDMYGVHFIPTENSILHQIKNWPKDVPFWPIALWVESRSGTLIFDEKIWNYSFHGQGVTFICTSNNMEISLEYTLSGDIGITEWNVALFINSIAKENSELKVLLETNEALFLECVRKRYLIPCQVRWGSDSETFVLSDLA